MPARSEPPGLALAPDSDTRWVPFELTPGNQIRFRMEVDGREASAILDTGVSFSVVSWRFAQRAGLRPSSRGQAEAIGGTVDIGWAPTRSLQLGGLTRTGGHIAIVDLKAAATGSTAPVDALVGADLLACCALDIDYDARRFRLLPSGRLPFQGTRVPLSLSEASKVFLSEVTIGGRRIAPVIVDTGDGSSITLSREGWTAARVKSPALTSAVAFGLGGRIETDLAVLPALNIGPLAARDVEVRIEAKDGFSSQTGTAGRIGSSFLQRYRVLMDPRAAHMVFQPGERAAEMPVRSTSGLLVGHEPGRLRVLHVMRGGPAAAAGWQEGELICTVDGQAVPAAPAPADAVDTGWSAGPPGRIVELGLCDGSVRKLTLRKFY